MKRHEMSITRFNARPRATSLGETLNVLFSFIAGFVTGQKRTRTDEATAVDFECPEEFGYYRDVNDCTR